MNIAIVIPTIEAGGAEKQAVLLAQCLAEYHQVTFYVFFGNLPKEQKHLNTLAEAGVELVSLDGSIWIKIRQLTKRMKEKKTEVAFNYLTMCDGVGSLAEKRAGVKYIYNGIRSSRLQGWKERIERFCHNHWITATICNSFCATEYFGARGFDKDKLIVIQNCFPVIDPYFERTDIGAATVITVGRFDPVKDYETSIRAVAEAYKQCRDMHYVIVGHGVLEADIRRWVKEYGIEKITKIHINPSNIPELLRRADIFLTTSLYEGTSNAVMEALNASLPVVCTDVGDNRYLVKEGEGGFVHPTGDVAGISASIVKLLFDASLRARFGKSANDNLKENFSKEIFCKRYMDLLKRGEKR